MLTLDEEKPTINKEMPTINNSQVESYLNNPEKIPIKNQTQLPPPPLFKKKPSPLRVNHLKVFAKAGYLLSYKNILL